MAWEKIGSAITENERTVTGMAEYIEREALLKFIENGINNPDRKEAFGYDTVEILEKVQYMPAADVAPVRHGRWIDGDPYCPICRKDKFRGLDADVWSDWKPDYCPNCGARMDLEK